MNELQRKLEEAWYEENNCGHAHCPNGCSHPQPFLAKDGRMLCGACAIEGDAVEVVPCSPETNCKH